MDARVPGYVLLAPLGGGGDATVHRGEELATGRTVAVKRVPAGDAAAIARLRSEAGTLAALAHPNILRVLDVLAIDDGLAIVLPLADGSLADRLAAHGPRPAAEVAEVGAAIASALAAAHDVGVVHRDVTPGNVLFDREGVPVLADFGTASIRTRGSEQIVGTAEYLDPEVRRGALPGVASDVYGLGVTLYEALTGAPPYLADTPDGTLALADRGVHAPLRRAAPHAPTSLTDAIERAMARDPEQRFASARDLRQALEAARLDADGPSGGGHTIPATDARRTRHFGPRPTPPPVDDDTPRAGRRWGLWAAIAAAVLLPVLAIVLLPRVVGDDPADSPIATTGAPATSASDVPLCPGEVEPEAGAGATVLAGDLTGAGCATYVVWEGGVLEVPQPDGDPAVRYRMGEPDDLPVLGDWDCDGVDTPGVYRPATGEVFLFDGFAGGDGELTSRPGYATGRRGGTPVAADTDDDGCDEVTLDHGR